jgi:hypothetical protein
MFDLLQRLDGGEILGLVAITGGVLVAVIAIVMGVWSSMHHASHQTALKREMLARGMSIDEIERLSLSEEERKARLKADQKVRKAQIDADLKRDMVARGVSVGEVQQLTGSGAKPEEEAMALADTIVRMVRDGELDRNAVARLIAMFLKRDRDRESTHVTANGA